MLKDQAWTVAVSLLSPLVVAMLVIPMLVTTLFSDKKKTVDMTPPMRFIWYHKFLEKTVEKRNLVIVLSLVMMIGSALLIPKLGSEFMPRSESAEFTVNLRLPEGTSLERTESTATKPEEIIRGLLSDKIKLIYCQSGSDNTSSMSQTTVAKGENSASLKVILNKDFASRTEEAISLIDTYLKRIPDIEINFTREETALQSSLGTTNGRGR